MNAANIVWPQGRYNPGGVSRVVYAFVEDIASFPTLADPETATTFESLVLYANPIVMKTGKSFKELYCTLEEGEVKSEMVGPRDGKSRENSIEISFPGSEAEFLGFKAACSNRQMIFGVLEKNRKVRIVGTLDDPAFLETDSETSGKKNADGRKTMLMFKAAAATSAPIYHLGIDTLLVPGT